MRPDPRYARQDLCNSPATGRQVPLSTFVHYTSDQSGLLPVNHQGQFPSATLSFNLAPGVSPGQAVNAVEAAEAAIGAPAALIGGFQGSPGVSEGSGFQPYLILAALTPPILFWRALRELYPSAHNSFDTSVRGRRSFLVLDAVPRGYDADLVDRDSSLDRHRQEERNHDGRFRHQRATGAGIDASRGNPGSMSASLPADHDDDNGRNSRRYPLMLGTGDRIWTAPAAWSIHGWRLARQSVADLVHHAGDLPRLESLGAAVHRLRSSLPASQRSARRPPNRSQWALVKNPRQTRRKSNLSRVPACHARAATGYVAQYLATTATGGVGVNL